MNFRVIENFIDDEAARNICDYGNSQIVKTKIENVHIKEVNEGMNGWSILSDLSKTPESKLASKYQGDATVVEDVPELFHDLAAQIAVWLDLPQDHVFFQYINIGNNGQVKSHYDVGIPGFITYKCNVYVDGPELDVLEVSKTKVELKPHSLYAFEASLYKHSMPILESHRVHLSYGFLVPYSRFNRTADDPRVKLSGHIWRKFLGH